jgi:alkylation response protein AidB-like acyl-CoA dehydrogenase
VNFDLSEDEGMLKALAERFVGDHYDIERRRTYQATGTGFCPANWKLLGDLGLIAAPMAEADGGLGLDATGLATVFEALGHGLVVEPLIENVVLAARLFAATAMEPLRGQWLPKLISGEARLALAHAETGGRPGRTWIETTVDTSGARISGTKAFVPAGAGVDGFVISARASGTPGDREGVELWFVAANSQGLVSEAWRMADGSVAVSLALENVEATRLTGEAAIEKIETVDLLASLARSAEALGIMERIFAETQDYLRTREQFGVKLASFQALQHRMVAQYAVIEQSRALLNLALVSWGGDDFDQAVLGLRAFIAPACIILGHEMIQLHGAMGVTDELAIGHAHKRLLVLSRWPDEPESALDRFAGI